MVDEELIFPRLVARRAAESPDRVLIEHVRGGSLTYAELLAGGQLWGGAYRRIGVGERDNVVLMTPVTLDYYRSWLGLTLIKAVDVGINTEYRGDLLVHVLNNSMAPVMMCAPEFVERVAEVLPRLDHLRTIVVLGPDTDVPDLPIQVLSQSEFLAGAEPLGELDPVRPWDISCILYTSGTTGPSKGVVLPWAHLQRQTVNFLPFADLGPDDVYYLPTVTYHLGGKTIPYLMALCNGTAVVRERFSPNDFWDDVKRYGVTSTALVGAMVPWISAGAPPADDENNTLTNVIMAPVMPDVDGFKARFGVRVGTAYSMTEISNPFASDGWSACNANHKSCGRLKPGFEVRIVDDHDEEVPIGEVGELIVRTDEPWTMNLGYFNMPEASFHAWRNGWFHTGDGFRRDEDGAYYFCDRMKDAIRRRGENISSFEVEGIVNQHPDVIESAAIAVPSEHTEDEVMSFVVRTDGSELTEAELIEWLIPRMPRFMVPRYIEFIDALPKTPTDRVKKKDLRERGVTEAAWDREAADIVIPR